MKTEALKQALDAGGLDAAMGLALLVDGLEAEREQGITIDVASLYASTPRRFVITNSPGHEQYTRNMATAVSTGNLAVVPQASRQGVLT